MTTKIAKPVLKNKSWLIFEDGHKIGTVQAVNRQYLVKIKDRQQELAPTVDVVKNKFNVEFLKYQPAVNKATIVSDYPTVGAVYNPVYNLLYRIPMYTQKPRSRCWHGAGYYAVNINGQWRAELCPKVIYLTRNKFCGPFKTREEADAVFGKNTLV
jgi:hypothetical protein